LPGVADYRGNPLRIKGLEEIAVEATHTTAGGAVSTIGLWIADKPIMPAPQGDVFTLRGTATTTLTANAWSLLAITWQDSLPAGNYACVGLQVQGATAKLARMIFEDQINRPGCLGQTNVADNSHPIFRMGGLGTFGRFTSNRMPNVEVLAGAADTVQEIYMDIVRIN
jgi:hypothetical protein